jgi:hypothetical protein
MIFHYQKSWMFKNGLIISFWSPYFWIGKYTDEDDYTCLDFYGFGIKYTDTKIALMLNGSYRTYICKIYGFGFSWENTKQNGKKFYR